MPFRRFITALSTSLDTICALQKDSRIENGVNSPDLDQIERILGKGIRPKDKLGILRCLQKLETCRAWSSLVWLRRVPRSLWLPCSVRSLVGIRGWKKSWIDCARYAGTETDSLGSAGAASLLLSLQALRRRRWGATFCFVDPASEPSSAQAPKREGSPSPPMEHGAWSMEHSKPSLD